MNDKEIIGDIGRGREAMGQHTLKFILLERMKKQQHENYRWSWTSTANTEYMMYEWGLFLLIGKWTNNQQPCAITNDTSFSFRSPTPSCEINMLCMRSIWNFNIRWTAIKNRKRIISVKADNKIYDVRSEWKLTMNDKIEERTRF